MCSKNNFRNISSHSWSLSSKTMIYLMIPIKYGSLKEISMKFFLSQILPVEWSINTKIKYENFMIDVRLISILNLISLVITFSSNTSFSFLPVLTCLVYDSSVPSPEQLHVTVIMELRWEIFQIIFESNDSWNIFVSWLYFKANCKGFSFTFICFFHYN